MGSLKPINKCKHYGSLSGNGIPTVGKNNLPVGGKVANAFCYNEFETARAATPSKTNPNVVFLRRSSSVMSSARSVSHNLGRIYTGCDNNVALY